MAINIFWWEQDIFHLKTQELKKKHDIDTIKDIASYNALWLMSIKSVHENLRSNIYPFKKITKKQFWVSSTGYISSKCWVLFSILHKQFVIKEGQLSGGRSMKRTRYSITQTCRKTNTDRPLIIVKWFLVFPIYQYKRVAVH